MNSIWQATYRLLPSLPLFWLLLWLCSYFDIATTSVYAKIFPETPTIVHDNAQQGLLTIQELEAEMPQIMQITFQNRADLQYLANHFDVWDVNWGAERGTGYVVAPLVAADEAFLRLAGYPMEIDKVQNQYMQQLPALMAAQGGSSGIPGFACYRTVEETYASMEQLEIENPNLVQRIDIGDSWDKVQTAGTEAVAGHDIYALVLTDQRYPGPKPDFVILAEVHAREYVTSETALRFAERLVEQYGKDPDITWLLRYHEVHIIPMANPDGRKKAEQGFWWRKNTNTQNGCPNENPYQSYYGTDLNRNSSFKWNKCDGFGCSTNDPCKDTFRGPNAKSEPETQAYQAYIASVFLDQRGPSDEDAAPEDTTGVFLTIHSYSELVLIPWGWTQSKAPNAPGLQTLGRKFGFYTQYETCYVSEPGCLYQADGTTDDWVYGELGVPAYTFELGKTFFESCSYFEEEVLERNIQAFLYGFKSVRHPYQTAKGPEIINASLNMTYTHRGVPVQLTAQANDARYFSGNHGDEPTQNITAARYSIDSPAWFTDTLTYAMSAADGSFDANMEQVQATLDTSKLTPGPHLILVEGQDADGNWGVATAVQLEISSTEMVVTPPQKQVLRPFIGTTGRYTLTIANYSQDSKFFQIDVEAKLFTAQTFAGNVTENMTEQLIGQTTAQQSSSDSSWHVDFPQDKFGPVAPGQEASFVVSVNVPVNALFLEKQETIVNVSSVIESPGDTVESQQVILVTHNDSYKHFMPITFASHSN